ncbi:hypothetical protein AB4455_21655 [Vibrio sp. 10N.261.46.E12]|uniref:hypothetical protein n=1 Tax=unclassified Vibrio TaxID=2614977 RepID=UPI0009789788|nr:MULTISPECIES: hypothetical protein [unclassified Vibrio]OMO37471.1 hypothetical protein BH584_01775 [Vibrio sp. 10N.261.45.E1]PMJ31423.1 hypothetical protein BCU27_25545 [Vibrio sp. 10N.286.45.B6]PML95966.1 hypothetical protein BCT66_22505 [Vibrio sp. 10N.261.49.E11]PMM88075.1 hypothetical protein BCT46_25825 [Vibrio sp. 10N.261.46.E8]PMN46021.1 hypothetical protein BCT32_11370 [Vibrio sp. 10N.261.45.E11]
MKKIEISDENYLALCSLSRSNEAPNEVLTRLLQISNKPTISFGDLNVDGFKDALLRTKVAQVCIEYHDRKDRDIRTWKATNIKETSNIKGNIQSNYLRSWKSEGISSINLDVLDRKLDLELLSVSMYLGITYREVLILEPSIQRNDQGEYEYIEFKNLDVKVLANVNKEVLNGIVHLGCKYLPRQPNPFLYDKVNPYYKSKNLNN